MASPEPTPCVSRFDYNWRLLKARYVTVPVEAFTSLKVPANSSARTRAELDYLLDLQARRRAGDREWCLTMAGIYHHPSGHSLASYINAGVLARLAPARQTELLARAHELAWSRELLGVHYPSDPEAGQVLAEDFVRFLFENPAFVRDFESARHEWALRSAGQVAALAGRLP